MPSGRTHFRFPAAVIAGLAVACLAVGFTGNSVAADVGSHDHGQAHSASFAPGTGDGNQPALHQQSGNPAGGAGWRTSSDPTPADVPTADVRPQLSVAVRVPATRPVPQSLPVRILFGVWLN
jgi:hypothetical protein